MSRRRYVLRPNESGELKLVEVGADFAPTPRVEIMPGTIYDGLRATDGTDIGSRAKRREYMKAHGLADADDYKGAWSKAAEERQRMRTEVVDAGSRREAVARAVYQAQNRRKR